MRLFDLRNLHHSKIVYEDVNHFPLLRLAWNKQDANYLATFAMDSVEVSYLFIYNVLLICLDCYCKQKVIYTI